LLTALKTEINDYYEKVIQFRVQKYSMEYSSMMKMEKALQEDPLIRRAIPLKLDFVTSLLYDSTDGLNTT